METKNSVLSLQKEPFHRRTLEEKLLVKELGPEQPDINIKEHIHDRGRSYTRSFSTSWYKKKAWLTASSETRAMFCFPCLLFQVPGTEQAWTHTGITTIKHFYDKANKHEQTKSHIENAMRLALFGNASIAVQLSEGYRTAIRRHNEEVDQNRLILKKVIDCFKCCGAFEGALRGHDESEHSKGLSDLDASLNAAFDEHLQIVTVFNGTSKTVQNELLDCMLSVAREQIVDEIRSTDFISIIVEASDIPAQCQFVIVIRYIDKAHNVQERFFELVSLQNATADSVATALLERLSSIIPAEHKTKLISQSYDGASVMRGATGGVRTKVQAVYENAHHVHCYAHQVNLVMQKVTSHMTKVRQFFFDVTGLSDFFSRSPKRTGVLDKVVVHRLPRSSAARRNFPSRAVNTVYEHKDDLLQCFVNIRDSDDFDPASIREAGGFLRLLEDEMFSFFLELFHLIMPHVDILYSEFQRRSINMIFIARAMKEFKVNLQKISASLPGLCDAHNSNLQQQQEAKKRCTRGPGELQTLATEVR
uniref:TTF-type domain-containing protein n=1 Tax=Sphaeramia orbicularis TaxID=375764 RepID=A0A673AEA0_9TELE